MKQLIRAIVLRSHGEMSKFLLLTCMATVTYMIPCRAQRDDYAKEKAIITEVKRNPSKYVYAEATCKTKEEAKAVAEEMFLENVNEYAAGVKKLKGAENIVINDQKGLQQEITMPRGTNMHRVFFYVKKSDIVAMKNPKVIRNQPSTPPAQSSTHSLPSDSVQKMAVEVPQVIQEITSMKSVTQLNSHLKNSKQSGKIAAYDKYNNIEEKSDWYLVIYDSTGQIKAVLTDGKERTNIATNKPDSERNYPGHAAIGVKMMK